MARNFRAFRLWQKGFGEGCGSIEAYLDTIPEVPKELHAGNERFPLLVLVDQSLGLTRSCALAGVHYPSMVPGDTYPSGDPVWEGFNPTKAKPELVYWMRAQDGRRYRGSSVRDCRALFAKDEVDLTAMEGVALYIQHPDVIEGHALRLGGSIPSWCRSHVADLHGWNKVPHLGWCPTNNDHPDCGSASRLK